MITNDERIAPPVKRAKLCLAYQDAVVVNKLRTRPFHASKPGEVTWRLELWHQVRIVWVFMQGQDLDALYARILARGSSPGRPVIDPRILVALWLNAALDAVGSARELERRCEQDVGYKWLCGGVSVNYHTLSDFRVAHGDFLDDTLRRHVARTYTSNHGSQCSGCLIHDFQNARGGGSRQREHQRPQPTAAPKIGKIHRLSG